MTLDWYLSSYFVGVVVFLCCFGFFFERQCSVGVGVGVEIGVRVIGRLLCSSPPSPYCTSVSTTNSQRRRQTIERRWRCRCRCRDWGTRDRPTAPLVTAIDTLHHRLHGPLTEVKADDREVRNITGATYRRAVAKAVRNSLLTQARGDEYDGSMDRSDRRRSEAKRKDRLGCDAKICRHL